mmetsp:Transcript_88683/g.248141  ORF Transcript_88683/g.248141 Transcript_88683/m.248141 type:complete len:220 (-) Transcript_88683:690-1349(-)
MRSPRHRSSGGSARAHGLGSRGVVPAFREPRVREGLCPIALRGAHAGGRLRPSRALGGAVASTIWPHLVRGLLCRGGGSGRRGGRELDPPSRGEERDVSCGVGALPTGGVLGRERHSLSAHTRAQQRLPLRRPYPQDRLQRRSGEQRLHTAPLWRLCSEHARHHHGRATSADQVLPPLSHGPRRVVLLHRWRAGLSLGVLPHPHIDLARGDLRDPNRHI